MRKRLVQPVSRIVGAGIGWDNKMGYDGRGGGGYELRQERQIDR
jgi:hypothetical protein